VLGVVEIAFENIDVGELVHRASFPTNWLAES
jgi:hypothetical protein